MTETTFWGIHGGRTGEVDSLFLKKGFVALGWPRMGNLSELRPTREDYRARLAERYPDKKPGAIPTDAGQLYRFVHEMTVDDVVIYFSKRDRLVHLGVIQGPYRHAPELEEAYPHVRPARWERSVPRTTFSQGALYELGSAMSFFQVKNHADEFRAALLGDTVPLSGQDEAPSVVADDIEDLTRDFVLRRLSTELKGHPLTHFMAHLLNRMGYRTRVSPEGADGGVDILAHKDELGFEPPMIKVQVKSGAGNVGQPEVASLSGILSQDEYGLFVALGSYTSQAKSFARGRSNLRLIDGAELVDIIFRHYDTLDSNYKGLLPLRRVYVPEELEKEG